MSTNGEEIVTLEEVREQYNLIERLTHHLGVDDNLTAALLANQAQLIKLERRQAEFLAVLTGQPVEIEAPLNVTVENIADIQPPDVHPEIEVVLDQLTTEFPENVAVDIEGIELDPETIEQAFQDATKAINRVQLYGASSEAASDNILSQPVRPMTDHSTFRVSVTLDTATTFSARVDPDDEDAFTEDLNQGGNLQQDAKREFSFDVDPDAKYNFRMGTSGTVTNLRVQEILTE